MTTAFIGEELAVQVEFYKMLLWKHVYGIPIYYVIYLLAHKLANTKTVATLT
ncbi:MAG TPA: hypothetical protein VEY70_08065 [Metabacillus sp.]|nr:hypothetical protein [Metabacillus sp.]